MNSGKDLEKREDWWHPEFNVKVMMNPHPVLISTLFTRLKAASEAGKTFTMILGNPEPDTYIPLAQLINYFQVDCSKLHLFAMDEWADEDGELGPVYGVQWRSWPAPNGESIDQISQVMESLANSPGSRRHLVSAWNPGQLDEMALPACHAMFQFHVQPEENGPGKLSCQLYQRSADMFLGVPFNIAEYSLLTMMMAHQLGYNPGEFIWTGGDVHIYSNLVDQVLEQLTREPYPYPQLRFRRKPKDLFSYEWEDFELVEYQHHPTIKAPVAV